MGKHWKRRPKKSKNEDHILRLYAAADGETSLPKTMGRGFKRSRNAMNSDHSQRLDANAADGETSLLKTMDRGSKIPRKSFSLDSMEINHSQRLDANTADGETSLLKTMDRGSKIPRKSFSLGSMEIGESSNPQNSLRSRARLNMDFLGGTSSKSFEEIKIYLDSMSKKMQIDAVYSSAPESVASLSELGSLSELSEACGQLEKLEPLVCEVKERKDGAKGRMHHLEVKQLLLLTYCQAILSRLILKAEGCAVQDHPTKECLVEIKAMLDQMKRIEVVADCYWTERDNKYVNLSRERLKMRDDLEAKLTQKGIYNNKNSKSMNQKNSAMPMKQKNSSMPMNKYLESQDDFDDDVYPLATGGKRSFSTLSKLIPDKGKKPQVFSGDYDFPVRDFEERCRKYKLSKQKKSQVFSGDYDLPVRRMKHEIEVLENEQVDAKKHQEYQLHHQLWEQMRMGDQSDDRSQMRCGKTKD